MRNETMQHWYEIKTAPKYEQLFCIRYKDKPHVQFEAMFFQEMESYELPEEYDVLYNMTLDAPIDEYWEDLEWAPIPHKNCNSTRLNND